MQEDRRFFVENIDENAEEIVITGSEYKHIANVLRAKVGDKVVCFCGDKIDYTCEIIDITKTEISLKIIEKSINLSEPEKNYTLFQALPKGDKIDLIVQKAVELGFNKVVPFTSKFTISKDNENKNQRLNKIALEAVKQCGRNVNFEVSYSVTFKQMLEKLKDFDIVLFAFEGERENEIKNVLNKVDKDKIKNVALIIGSEGGFDKDEAELIKENGGKILSLGNRILRAETASISVMGIVMYEFDEMVCR